MNKYISFLRDWRGNVKLICWLAGHMRAFLSSFFLLLAVNTLNSLTTVGLTLAHKRVIDAATDHGDIRSNILLYAAVALSVLLVGSLGGIISAIINERFSFGIRCRVYGSVLRACLPDTGRYHSGDFVTRLTSDINIVATGLAEIIPALLSLAVTFLAAFFTLAHYDRRLALFALVMGPAVAVISVLTGRFVRRLQVKLQESESAYRANLQESLENLIVLKAFEGQPAAEDRLGELRENHLHLVMQRQKVGTVARLSLHGAFQIGFILVFTYSAYQLSRGDISFGTMTLFFSLVGQVQSPIMNLAQMIPRIVSIMASAGRLREIEELPQEETDFPALAAGALSLEIRELSFAYGDEWILQNASASIRAGEFVALMGSSGIGKTTLVRLIMAFYMPRAGSLELVDADGARGLITAGARRFISYVPQGNTLMSGTIAYNLRTGNPAATEEEMWRVLSVVAADGFVRETPAGLYTVIGERGLGLSEGQAQRLSIARALIRNAPLLILDEATSALDEETELSVLRHLMNATSRPTCLLITHRRSVLQFCDRCLRIHHKSFEEMPTE